MLNIDIEYDGSIWLVIAGEHQKVDIRRKVAQWRKVDHLVVLVVELLSQVMLFRFPPEYHFQVSQDF